MAGDLEFSQTLSTIEYRHRLFYDNPIVNYRPSPLIWPIRAHPCFPSLMRCDAGCGMNGIRWAWLRHRESPRHGDAGVHQGLEGLHMLAVVLLGIDGLSPHHYDRLR